MHQKFRFRDSGELLARAKELGLDLPFDEDISPLFQRADLNGRMITNRLVVQPMEGYDSNPDGSPSDLTVRRYMRYAGGGSGIIWFEALAVMPEGRSNPRQLTINGRNRDSYKRLLGEMRGVSPRGIDPFIVAQITHSGRYSRTEGFPSPLVPQENTLLGNEPARIVSDDGLRTIQDRMVDAAILVKEAGFDAVDIKSCHGYLVHELLSSRNRTNSIYGGKDHASRFRFLLDTIDRIKAEVAGLCVTVRLSIYDGYKGGFGTSADGSAPDLAEPLMLAEEIGKRGVNLINITMGNPYFNPHVVRPYDTMLQGMIPPGENPLEGVARMIRGTAQVRHRLPGMMVTGSAYSWLRQFAPNAGAAAIRSGSASFIGFGRNSFAYPSMPLDLMKNGKADPRKVCITCSGCTRLIRNLRPGGCVIHDRKIYGEELKKLIADGK